MPQNAYREDWPVEMELDLLVDGELPEERRRALLLALDRGEGGAEWRGVALRFLQQQTEKESVRKLMAGGRLVPVEVVPVVKRRRAIIGRVGWRRISAVAAGLMIAVTSAVVTLVATKPVGMGLGGGGVATATPGEFQTTLPADMVEGAAGLAVSVPVVPPVVDGPLVPVLSGSSSGQPVRNSIIVRPDGNEGFVVIPVSMSRKPVY